MPYKLAINTATHPMPMVDTLLIIMFIQSHMKLTVTQIAPSMVIIGKTPFLI